MTKQIRYFFLLSLIVLAVSCKKKTPEDIGLPILPGHDLLNAQFTDTLTLITHTVADDSIPTKNVAPMLLGNMNDPVFGISKASIFTQVTLVKANPVFGTATLDSAVLSIVYSSGQYYGTLSAQKFKVYEVTEALSKDSTYYSNRMVQYGAELGSAYLTPNLTSSVTITHDDTITYPPHLRIRLDKDYFQKFLEPSFASNYTGNDVFQPVFKGLYIASSTGAPTGQGGIFYMDQSNSYTRITLYYHNATDTTSYYFGFSKDATFPRFSHFEHDYSAAAEIKTQLNSGNTIQQDKVFVQPMGGVRTKITMPYLNDLFSLGKIVINKAELILPVDPASLPASDSIYIPHPKLVATIADSALGPVIMPDYFEGATYFGGDYDADKKEYRFNIARYLQQVLSGKRENQGLYIIANARPTTANRVQLVGGGSSLTNRIRLKITYTPLY